MDETDLMKLPSLGRYKACALNDKKIEKTWFKQLLTVKAIHYYFKNILVINVYPYRFFYKSEFMKKTSFPAW